MARVATTPRAIARASSVARVDRARPRRRRRRATRSRARVSDVSDVSDDDDDAVAAHALVERRSLLDSDDAEADARRRALANARAIAATADGGDVMRDVDADVLPLLLRLRSAGASAEGLRRGAAGVRAWRDALARGLLPDASLEWPEDETFRTALIEALGDLDMARFTRRFPPVLDTLMKNVLDILYVYERDREDEDATPELPPTEPRDSETANDGEGEGDARGSGAGESDEEEGEGEARSQAGGRGGAGEETDGSDNVDEFDVGMDGDDGANEAMERAKEKNKEIVSRLMEEFKEQWEPAMDKLDKAAKAFEGLDLDDLADGPEGFDLTRGLWQQTGWKELDSLRKKLQDLKELRDMVRSLGRGSGRGPLRRAPRQRERQGFPIGLVRSPMEPEQTSGLCRSDDLSRMMPSEMVLLASSLPQARLLHFARRAERTLLSYERVGWSEEPAVTVEGFETRPAAECGPIIVCLDTSGSMMGARETVAKAMVLECMRQSRSQQRACYLYSFSGPGDCQELELKLNAAGLYGLLEFLSGSFHGGTDVDEPFNRALARLNEAEWSNADILLVTDGEIKPPDETLIANLNEAKEEMGLKVHGLLVGDAGNAEVVESICTHVHAFKSWTAVGGKPS
jgi:uncharacterized protein with von Willebrand factor type A (vWA) domain